MRCPCPVSQFSPSKRIYLSDKELLSVTKVYFTAIRHTHTTHLVLLANPVHSLMPLASLAFLVSILTITSKMVHPPNRVLISPIAIPCYTYAWIAILYLCLDWTFIPMSGFNYYTYVWIYTYLSWKFIPFCGFQYYNIVWFAILYLFLVYLLLIWFYGMLYLLLV